MNFDLSASEDEEGGAIISYEVPASECAHRAHGAGLTRAGTGDSIDGVFGHKRDGEHGTSRLPFMDLSLNTRAAEDPDDEPKRNLRFLVKWQSYSHIHNTWETFDHLRKFKGFKRVENYIKGPFALQRAIRKSPKTSPEDIEALEIEKERQAELLEGYKQVERIVAERNAPANADIDHDHRSSSPLL